eukprot:TRINITY_DN5803_c0_g1_i2.p1 TRINITY_DN5803_c0_g1~~TRINITY_DN5803_c0_g1_i2.p1  ORF type:complete len:173 (+),score=57.04 TRINITY_DN5803_c0_g1_i2:53-571(+)
MGRHRKLQSVAQSTDDTPIVDESHLLGRVASLRGGSVVEVVAVDGVRGLCRIPAKFRHTLFVRIGSCVVFTAEEMPLKDKFQGEIFQILSAHQIQALKDAALWPESYLSSEVSRSKGAEEQTEQDDEDEDEDEDEENEDEDGDGDQDEDDDDDDDDELFSNPNHNRPTDDSD